MSLIGQFPGHEEMGHLAEHESAALAGDAQTATWIARICSANMHEFSFSTQRRNAVKGYSQQKQPRMHILHPFIILNAVLL